MRHSHPLGPRSSGDRVFPQLPCSPVAFREAGAGLDYVRPLDGLRGVAVLAVLLGHFGAPGFRQGGGLGVDVFFVLSGYLITRVLLRDMAERRPLAIFYWHRCTRLLPSLLLVSLSLFLLPESVLSHLGAALNAAGALSYTTNWTRAVPVIGWPSFMAHTWSLSVEEQFYLVWPAVLALCLHASPRHAGWLVAAVLGLSVLWVANAFSAGWPEGRIYNGFDTRCPALLAGAGLAFLPARPPAPALRHAALAVLFLLFVTAGWSVPAFALASAATAVIIASLDADAHDPVLSSRILVWLGSISYALYLWHWPVSYLWSQTGRTGAGWAILGILISIVLAALTTAFVEQPARKLRDAVGPSAKRRLGLAAFALTLGSFLAGMTLFYSGVLTVSPY